MTSSPITLTQAITALVTEKRAVGFKYVAEERVLTRFAAFCRTEFGGVDAPTQTSVEAWIAAAGRRGVAPATLQCLVAPVRELARWLGRRGIPAYVLPTGTLPISSWVVGADFDAPVVVNCGKVCQVSQVEGIASFVTVPLTTLKCAPSWQRKQPGPS